MADCAAPGSEFYFTVACGYFVWDLVVVVVEGWDYAFYVHAIFVFLVYFFSLVRTGICLLLSPAPTHRSIVVNSTHSCITMASSSSSLSLARPLCTCAGSASKRATPRV